MIGFTELHFYWIFLPRSKRMVLFYCSSSVMKITVSAALPSPLGVVLQPDLAVIPHTGNIDATRLLPLVSSPADISLG